MNSRSSSQLPHRVSVVWFSDLVGWSSLTSENEDQAISLVRRFQAAVRAVVADSLREDPRLGALMEKIGLQ